MKGDLSNNIVAVVLHWVFVLLFATYCKQKLIVLEKGGHVSKVPFKGSNLCNG